MTEQTLEQDVTARDEGDGRWTLIFTRRFNHPIDSVWDAITDPGEIDQWGPYTPDRPLTSTGPVTLSQKAGEYSSTLACEVTVADRPTVLEYTQGESVIRWELKESGDATSLTVFQTVPEKKYVAMGAAGYQICFDVLDALLDGNPVGKRIGGDAMNYGWKELFAGYLERFGG